MPDGGRARRRSRVLEKLRRFDLERMQRLMRYSLERSRKWRALWRTPHPTTRKTPVFIAGCNRSGTNMVCEAIGLSSHGWDYREREFSPAFSAYYLRGDWVIEQLIRRTPAPVVSFGSILDSQFTDRLLARFEGAKAIWVYRRYEDVANSCARMRWGPELTDFARWIAGGELERLGARGERVAPETIRLFEEQVDEDLSLEDAASLYWYLRNRIYFDLQLDRDPRVLLVQYEHAVLHKERAFRRIFDFLGIPFDPVATTRVFDSSVGKHSRPVINPAIAEACDALMSELDMRFGRTVTAAEGKEAIVEWRPGLLTQ